VKPNPVLVGIGVTIFLFGLAVLFFIQQMSCDAGGCGRP
jgi:hypothetical protein